MQVFSYNHYKLYLRECFPAQGEKRGLRRALAKDIGCGPGFISQVLNGDLHFSQEQAILATYFLKLTDEERDFFLIMVNRDRSGNEKLRTHYEAKMKSILRKREEIKTRISDLKVTPKVIANEYYSHWKYTAVHMAARISAYAKEDTIGSFLGLSESEVTQAVNLLIRGGFLTRKGSSLIATDRRIHLSKSSDHLERHHVNWRLDAVREVLQSPRKNLHYTSVMSISKEAHQQLNEMLLKFIEKSEPVIRDASDKQVSVLLLDLYELSSKKI